MTMTATMAGTFVASVARTGTLNASTTVTAAMSGSVYQLQWVEWSVNVGPAWSFFDIPAFIGTSSPTLDNADLTLRPLQGGLTLLPYQSTIEWT